MLCVLVVPPRTYIYMCVGEGEGLQGAPQVGVILLGRLLQVGLPPSISIEGGRKERGEGKESGRLNPPLSFSFPSFPSPRIQTIGAHQLLLGLVCPTLGPLGPYSLPRVAQNPFQCPGTYPVPLEQLLRYRPVDDVYE